MRLNFFKFKENDKQHEQNSYNPNIIVIEKKEPVYSDAYMHFDNLIWQFPTWIFGLLTIGIAIFSLWFGKDELVQENILGYKLNVIISLMYRFRSHQKKIRKDVEKTKLISPQILIQIFSNILVSILFIISAKFMYIEISNTIYLVVIIIVTIVSTLGEIFWDKHADKYRTNTEKVS